MDRRLYYILLGIILLSTFAINFYPRINYKYPIHVDEWRHFAYSTQIEENGIVFKEPYLPFEKKDVNEEIGFHLAAILIKNILFLPWLIFLRFIPALMATAMVFSVYLLGKELKIGLLSAFFAMLIPTTLHLLGPGFFVAVTFALIFLPLALRSVFFRKSYFQTFILSLIIIYSHPPTFVALIIILATYFLMNYKDKSLYRHGYSLIASILLAIPLFFSRIKSLFSSTIGGEAELSSVVFGAVANFNAVYVEFGLLITILAVIGMYYIFQGKTSKKHSSIFLTLAISFFILLTLNIIYQFFEKIPFMMPTRNYFYMFILISFLAAYGFRKIRKNYLVSLSLVIGLFLLSKYFSVMNSWLYLPNANFSNFILEQYFLFFLLGWLVLFVPNFFWNKNLNWIFLVLLILIPSVHSHLNQKYYHIIDDNDYDDFMFIKDNLNGTAVMHPWKALAFTPLTGMKVYSRLPGGPNKFYGNRNTKSNIFFSNNCTDTSFLIKNNISIVYGDCGKTNLTKVRDMIYYYG